MAEKPNRDLAQTMRCLLYSAGLGSQFWSYALRHAVYLKNRRPHTSLQNKTPYEMVNGTQPNLSHLRLFGSIVHIKSKAKRYMKLDKISSEGLFITYTGTDKIIYVVNKDGTNERTCSHFAFDEAHMSSNAKTLPPMAITLQHAGYRKPMNDTYPETTTNLQFKLLSPDTTTPTKSTPSSAGYDIYSSENKDIPPNTQSLIHINLAFEIPESYYGQLKSRSGLAFKHNIHVQAGTIDSDYRGEVKVLLSNESDKTFSVTKGMRIAQIIIYKLPIMQLSETTTLTQTKRDKNGFGSTGTHDILQHVTKHNDMNSLRPTTAAAASLNDNNEDVISPEHDDHEIYNVLCSPDPFEDCETITISIRGKHETQGIILAPYDVYSNKVKIVAVQPGTSPHNIKRWIHRIKNFHLLKINNIPIPNIETAKNIFRDIIPSNKHFKITDSMDQKIALHHEKGIPMLYFDQLSTIANRLKQIKIQQDNPSNMSHKLETSSTETKRYFIKMLHAMAQHGTLKAAKAILPKNKRTSTHLTRRKLKQLPEWKE